MPSSSNSAAEQVRPLNGIAGFLHNVRAGLRAVLFRCVHFNDIDTRPGQLVALVLVGLAIQLLAAFSRASGEGEFNFAGLPRALVYVPLLLFAAWVVARGRAVRAASALPIIFCSISLPFDLVFEAVDWFDETRWMGLDAWIDVDGWSTATWYLLYLWWLSAILIASARCIEGGAARRVASAFAMLVVVIVPLWYMPDVGLWQSASEGDDSGEASAVSQEDVLYAQSAMLDDALERLRPQRPGTPDLYFVGVAGYAGEDVFMKELDTIGALFRERFDTEGRMVALVNNPRTVGELPVASVTALSRVLNELGEVMNVDEDVLFLYMTSHGSENHRFAMQFAPLQLRDIEPQMLRNMLDQSGIKWRVIVISACYSGGFVRALEDEHTVVITASDAHHQSFGCGTQSDFTYFGRAYFDQALRQTTSFIEAFTAARARIADLERAEALAPSNPQMSVGMQIEQKLRELSQTLARRPQGLQVRLHGGEAISPTASAGQFPI